MRPIFVTQRVGLDEKSQERRDMLDQNWTKFLNLCGITPILVPNNLESLDGLFKTVTPVGVLLTGGNSLVKYGGDSPERDEMESRLIRHCIAHEVPMLGVCRGMQVIQDYFGVELKKISGHVRAHFEIEFKGERRNVNSFHEFGTTRSVPELKVLSTSSDGIVKAIEHSKFKILGMMWHPERVADFSQLDLSTFKDFFHA